MEHKFSINHSQTKNFRLLQTEENSESDKSGIKFYKRIENSEKLLITLLLLAKLKVLLELSFLANWFPTPL